MEYGFGVDVGGTTIKMGLFNEEGDLLEKWEIPTNTANGGAEILPDIAKAVENKIAHRKMNKANVMGIGVGVPGPVRASGIVDHAVNLGWGEKDVIGQLSELTGLKVKVGNDANVAALGENWMGGAKGFDSVVVVTLGTGVGGGIVLDGEILAGKHGAGGEIGHMCIDPTLKETCNCGNHGCLEQYASATGIVRVANAMLAETTMPSQLRKLPEVTSKDVFDAAKDGDDLAKEIVKKVMDKLALALSRIACVVDPEIFLIGGGVSKAGAIIIEELHTAYLKYAFRACKDTKFALCTLGNDAGIFGAVRMIF